MPCFKFRNAIVCSRSVYKLKVGRRKIVEFEYHPYAGVMFVDENGNEITGIPKHWWKALEDWMHRNTYQRAVRGNRELTVYVKKNWSP